ncbi:hypothetical protein EPN95_02840 [Patescibacteria group bacterium]|nr:MAG: hypothetical protein EPN95_02840 [Patescibacteria group bacterium]
MPLQEFESFAISRPVSEDDWTYINASIVDILKIPPQQHAQEFGHNVVLARRQELYRIMQQSGVLSDHPDKNIDAILEPRIASSLAPVEVPVDGVKFFGENEHWRNVALVVGGEDDTLSSERRTYLERARLRAAKSDRFEFNVTLARVRPEVATATFLAQLSAGIPSVITLNPVITTEQNRRRTPGGPTNPADNILPPISRMTNKDVRTLRPIPQSLLDSLKPKP